MSNNQPEGISASSERVEINCTRGFSDVLHLRNSNNFYCPAPNRKFGLEGSQEKQSNFSYFTQMVDGIDRPQDGNDKLKILANNIILHQDNVFTLTTKLFRAGNPLWKSNR